VERSLEISYTKYSRTLFSFVLPIFSAEFLLFALVSSNATRQLIENQTYSRSFNGNSSIPIVKEYFVLIANGLHMHIIYYTVLECLYSM
jgi:hypothetical protein